MPTSFSLSTSRVLAMGVALGGSNRSLDDAAGHSGLVALLPTTINVHKRNKK